jgi:Uma2 family endonuclease
MQPRVGFAELEQWPEDKAIRSAPDLAVEVLSPSTAGRDRGRKMQIFARYGVTEYWIIDSLARSVEIFWLNGETLVPGQSISASGMVMSTVLPELQFPAAALFRE